MKRIILNFMRFAVAVLIVFGRSVHAHMSDNEHFVTPNPTLPNIKAAIDDMETKAALAKNGSKQDKSNLKEARKKVVNLLRLSAWYVEGIAQGNENILISSGFELSKEPIPSQRDDFWIIAGVASGEMTIGCVAFPKAGAYIWQVSATSTLPAADKDWLFAGASTQRKTNLKGYTPDTKLWFRVRPVTPDGLMEGSDPILFPIR